jgi:hypothetical protein
MVAFEAGLLSVGALLLLSRGLGVPSGAPRPLARHGSRRAVRGFGRRDQGAHRRRGRLGDRWFALALARAPRARVGDRVYASARGLQKGDAVPVITLTGVFANVSSITGGLVVFGDAPSDPVGIVLQGLALLLVIVAAALMPGPLRLATA